MAKKKKQTKESIYDSQINPLMSQIIAICEEHKIAMLATFSVPNDEDKGLQCSTALLGEETNPPQMMLDACRIIYKQERSPLLITTRDKDGKVVSSTVVL